MAQLGALIEKAALANNYIVQFKADLEKRCAANRMKQQKPRVYFEEWGDPLITGIKWVSEIIELDAGIDIFGKRKNTSLAKNRIIADKNEVVALNPDIIIA